jgi:hypothetical protein
MTASLKTIESPDGIAGQSLGAAPCSLFHVTTGRKAKLYRQTGRINSPVRGFDTLMAAMAWAMKTGRKVIMLVEPVTTPQMLPDHHNDYGRAWWTDSVPIERVKCAYSAEGAWAQPDSLGGGGLGLGESATPKETTANVVAHPLAGQKTKTERTTTDEK